MKPENEIRDLGIYTFSAKTLGHDLSQICNGDIVESGNLFRQSIVEAFTEAASRGEIFAVDLRGTFGYLSAPFLDAAFAGLRSEFITIIDEVKSNSDSRISECLNKIVQEDKLLAFISDDSSGFFRMVSERFKRIPEEEENRTPDLTFAM